MMNPVRWTLAAAGAVILIAAIAIGGWQLNWWMASSATNHVAHIYQNSYGAQSSDEQQAQNLISQIDTVSSQISDPSTPSAEVQSLQAQRASMTTQACGVIANINTPTPDVAKFASANCG
jgi:hypothetical protein